jgi:hypothetical protein
MQEYFASVNRLTPANGTPRPGDVMTAVTTVGGNEGGIRIRWTEVGTDLRLLSYGSLD